MRVGAFLLAGMALLIGGAAPAWACGTNNTFNDNNNNQDWNDEDNWSDGVPTSSHNAIIPSNLTCIIKSGGNHGVACSIDVVGQLTVEEGRNLTISGNSIVDGTLRIDGTFTIDANVTIASRGTGDILLDGGTIVGDVSTDTLTLSEECIGAGGTCPLTLHGFGTVSVKLVNNSVVLADAAREPQVELVLDTNGKSGYGEWKADDGGQLSVEVEVTGTGTWRIPPGGTISAILIRSDCLCLEGDVIIEDGSFHANGASFCTFGDLTFESDTTFTSPTIRVDAGETFTASGTCPGECG